MSDTAIQALTLATEAKQQIESHESACEKQWAAANAIQKDIKDDIKWILRTLVVTLTAVAGVLFKQVFFS